MAFRQEAGTVYIDHDRGDEVLVAPEDLIALGAVVMAALKELQDRDDLEAMRKVT